MADTHVIMIDEDELLEYQITFIMRSLGQRLTVVEILECMLALNFEELKAMRSWRMWWPDVFVRFPFWLFSGGVYFTMHELEKKRIVYGVWRPHKGYTPWVGDEPCAREYGLFKKYLEEVEE